MKSKESLSSFLVNLAIWTTGILVSLAVGFGMIENGALNKNIPFLSEIGNGIIVSIAGWVVVILTLVSMILAIINKLRKYN